MDKFKLREQLKIDEGVKLTVYLDSVGLPTVGVGHLVLNKDKLKLGDTITMERCDSLLESDMNVSLQNCGKLFPKFEVMPENIQQVIANMMFNMGLYRLSGFKKFIAALLAKNYSLAADEMKNSKWYTQVGKRAQRLEKKIRETK